MKPLALGTYSLHPPGTLEHIADEEGVPVSQLSTLEVTGASETLYNALLEYCALHPRESCEEKASDAGGADETTSKGLSLWTSPDDAFENQSETDSDDEDADRRGLIDMGSSSGYPHSGLEAGSGLKRRRVPVPKLQFGLGIMRVTWPPPATMTAAIIEKLEKANAPSDSLNHTGLSKGSAEAADSRPSSDAVSAQPGQAQKDDSGKEGTSGKPQVVANDLPPRSIYVAHYAAGDPMPPGREGSGTLRIALVVSSHGPDALRDFARGVVSWRADKDYRPSRAGKFALYRFKTESDGGSGWWSHEGLKRPRPVSSIVLPDGQLEMIIDDFKSFLDPDTKAWYVKHGLPHRRSYLFYGPPGTGKTSTIRAMASIFKLNCCFLSMTNACFSNQVLGDALSQVPPNALIVLEDVDALFNEDRKNEDGGSLTFSGMLNALDGLMSTDGVITVMTTNHIERLDPALVRGGRVDRRFHFAKASQAQVENLFQSFYPDSSRQQRKRFAEIVFARPEGDEARSIATLQQLFIHERRSTADMCIEAIPEFFSMHFPSGTDGKQINLYS